MQRLSARPHHVGSPYDKDNAEWMLARFKEWGWDAQIEQLRRAVPDAEGTRARAGRADAFTAKLEEPAVAGDPTSGQKTEQLPTYNAYSIDGDVTAPLVYVNYGRAEDYEELERLRHLGAGRDRHRPLRADRGAASSRRSRPSTARSAA